MINSFWQRLSISKPLSGNTSKININKNSHQKVVKPEKPLTPFDLAVIEQEKRQAAHEAQWQAEQKAREEKIARVHKEKEPQRLRDEAQVQKLKEGRYREYMKKTPDLPIIYWLQGEGWGWRGRKPD
jgi:hypothetical protein